MSQNDKPNLPTGNPNVLAEDLVAEETGAQEETSGKLPNDNVAQQRTAEQGKQEADTATASAESLQAPEAESTVGTGTSMALGCIAGTVLLIVFALLFLGLRTLI